MTKTLFRSDRECLQAWFEALGPMDGMSTKVAKFVVVDSWVWCNVEMFLIPLDTFRATFERCVELLSEACGDFRQRMKRAPEKAQPVPAPSEHEGFCDDCAAELSAPEPTDEPERSH